MNKLIPLLFIVLLSACVNPINLHTGRQYFQGGLENAKEGKWFNARMAFGRAWTNANLGKADDKVTAVYAYEYGRASGAICDWKEAERGLKESYTLDIKTQGPVHMDLVELARMYHAKGALDKSEEYFSLAKKALDKIQADTRDSIGYANILAEYAVVLSALGRHAEEAILKKREKEIRDVFKDRTSSHDQTPYGKFCDQKTLTKKFERDIGFAAAPQLGRSATYS